MIIIVNYGIGNIQSLMNFLLRFDSEVVVTTDKKQIEMADLVVMPGVGSFGPAMKQLKSSGLNEVLTQRHQKNLPILGICLGMQLMFECSEESSDERGLSWFNGKIVSLSDVVRKPHMGWNEVSRKGQTDDFYFVHSFYASTTDPRLKISTCDYPLPFPAMIQSGNTFGLQFHPEISSEAGNRLMNQLMKEWQLCLKK